jgi:hypothetical protein
MLLDAGGGLPADLEPSGQLATPFLTQALQLP